MRMHSAVTGRNWIQVRAKLYLCNAFRDALRIKAAAQHSSSELGSAFTLHFICSTKSEE